MKSLFGLTSRVRSSSSISCINNVLRRTSASPALQRVSPLSSLEETAQESKYHEMVQEYYGKTLSTSSDLKTNACSASSPPLTIRNALKKVPSEIISKYYGCGTPLPFGIKGLTVLDLGSGSGRDSYIASQLVGEYGKVIGIDMTDQQLAVSKKYKDEFCTKTLNYKQSNLEFIKGYIEMLTQYLEPESIDIIISNCVINLSPRKDKVLSGAYSVLKEGGEFYFSDLYCDRRLSPEIKNDEILIGEGLGGALYTEDFHRICENVGFMDPRILSVSQIKVEDIELKKLVGNAKFYSITYRLFKNKDIKDKNNYFDAEDFGQIAIYNGTIDEHKDYYDLDDEHRFITNKPMLVCVNTANMVGNSWLSPHFEIIGNIYDTQYGLFH